MFQQTLQMQSLWILILVCITTLLWVFGRGGDGAGAIEFEIAVMLFAVSYVTAAAVHTLS